MTAESHKKTKICFFTGYFPLIQGGAEYQTYLLANSLDHRKYDVFFLSMGPDWEGMRIVDGYRIYNIKTNRLFRRHYYLYLPRIRRILVKEKPDVVYRRMAYAIPGLLFYLSKRLGFRFIWACSSDPQLNKLCLRGHSNILTLFDEILRVYGISRAHAVLVQTQEHKLRFIRNFGRDCYVVPNFHPRPKNFILKSEKPIRILWISNIKELKQPEIFIALAQEFRDYPELKFIMIGRAGGHWARLRDKCIGLDNFEYIGEQPVDKVNKILCESHILVNTSKYEGFPNTFIQAWMRKVPVISLNVDPDGVMEKWKLGFHSKSFGQMLLDLKKLIENRNLVRQMGENAQKYAFENHSMRNVKKVIDLIEAR